jgi:hypothetical protein
LDRCRSDHYLHNHGAASASLSPSIPFAFHIASKGHEPLTDGAASNYRELDDAVGLTDTGAEMLADARTGKNGRHRLAGLLRQSVFGRLAGYRT